MLIKPDGVQRSLIGEIVKRYEQTGLKLVGLKMLIPTEKQVEDHYTVDPAWIKNVGEKSIDSYKKKGEEPPFSDPEECGRAVLGRLKKYMTSSAVIGMIWEGNQAIGIVRKITGGTEPLSSDVGTIRGDYTLDSYSLADSGERAIRNLIHASGSTEEAEKEIAIWFDEKEIHNYKLVQEKILYDVNLDGLKE